MKPRSKLSRVIVNPQRLFQRQVEAFFQLAPSAMLFSYVGALISLAVVYKSDNSLAGLFWFAFATLVMLLRGAVLWQYWRQDDPLQYAKLWARMMVGVNFLAGVQWGLLGTVLFSSPDIYHELFITMVIICFVAGSIVPFAPIKWAHPALALPATIPTIIYVFFVRTGQQWLTGSMALFFVFTVLYFSYKQYRAVANRLSLELRNEALVAKLNDANSELGEQNNALKHRTAVVKRAQIEQRGRASILASHVEKTLLPVIECDAQFGIVSWNDAASQLLGYRVEEVCGQNLGELFFPPERQGNLPAFVKKLFEDGQATIVDMPLVNRNLQRIPLRFYITPISADDHTPLRIAIIMVENYAEPKKRNFPGVVGAINKGFGRSA